MKPKPDLLRSSSLTLLAFGKRIRFLRLKAGYSQENLASLSQLDRTYIGGIERGERNPSLKNILRIADALKVSAVELFISEEINNQ
jgi:transcriptional regulator with XRE-family HTH domain